MCEELGYVFQAEEGGGCEEGGDFGEAEEGRGGGGSGGCGERDGCAAASGSGSGEEVMRDSSLLLMMIGACGAKVEAALNNEKGLATWMRRDEIALAYLISRTLRLWRIS